MIFGDLIFGDLIFGNSDSWNDNQRTIASSGPFVLWAVLICAQGALWFAAAPALYHVVDRFKPLEKRQVLGAMGALSLFVIGGVLVGALLPDLKDWPAYDYLAHRTWKIGLLSVAGSLVGLYAASGIFAAYDDLNRELKAPSYGLSVRVKRYLECQEKLHLLLLVIGAVLGLAILGAGAERNVLLAFNDATCQARAPGIAGLLGRKGHCDAHFPNEYLIVYGLYFTTFLALAYAPAHLLLLKVGKKIRDDVVGLDKLTAADISDWKSKRDAFDEILDLRNGTAADFRAGVAILTPLAGSLVSLLFAAG